MQIKVLIRSLIIWLAAPPLSAGCVTDPILCDAHSHLYLSNQETEAAESVMDRFLAVGGLQHDFRKEGAKQNADIPASVREFASLVEQGKGENGAGVHLSGESKHHQTSEL